MLLPVLVEKQFLLTRRGLRTVFPPGASPAAAAQDGGHGPARQPCGVGVRRLWIQGSLGGDPSTEPAERGWGWAAGAGTLLGPTYPQGPSMVTLCLGRVSPERLERPGSTASTPEMGGPSLPTHSAWGRRLPAGDTRTPAPPPGVLQTHRPLCPSPWALLPVPGVWPGPPPSPTVRPPLPRGPTPAGKTDTARPSTYEQRNQTRAGGDACWPHTTQVTGKGARGGWSPWGHAPVSLQRGRESARPPTQLLSSQR